MSSILYLPKLNYDGNNKKIQGSVLAFIFCIDRRVFLGLPGRRRLLFYDITVQCYFFCSCVGSDVAFKSY